MAALTFFSHLLKTFTPTQHSALLPPISISFSGSHWMVSIGPKSRVAISAAISVENSSKDPGPTREQMIETNLNTLATVLGSMEETKKNVYAFSTTTYTGFQCTVDKETSEKFKGYINGEIISYAHTLLTSQINGAIIRNIKLRGIKDEGMGHLTEKTNTRASSIGLHLWMRK